jgi:hypothetical protein
VENKHLSLGTAARDARSGPDKRRHQMTTTAISISDFVQAVKAAPKPTYRGETWRAYFCPPLKALQYGHIYEDAVSLSAVDSSPNHFMLIADYVDGYADLRWAYDGKLVVA